MRRILTSLIIICVPFVVVLAGNAATDFFISPASYGFSSSSGMGSITVTTSLSSYSWTATSNDSWIYITAGSTGQGNGTVSYYADINTTGFARKGTITIGGQTFTVRQAKDIFIDESLFGNFLPDVYAIYTEGITTGCGNGYYCPLDWVTRGQMAAFIIRSLYGENFYYTPTPYFTDVPSTHGFFKYVQKMKDTGITAVSGTYLADDLVTRGQMAAFIIRSLYGEIFDYTLTPYFVDVPSTHPFFKYVQKMRDTGITAVTGTYDVDGLVTREQMATFLSRAFLGGSTGHGSNVQSIAVNGGPTALISSANGGYIYPNAAFTSVTVCVHATSNCQTIDGVLVDTGSFGLRLLSSVLTPTLYKTPTAGSNLGECVQFADGSYVWGSIQTFDVKLAGELASSVPIHVLDPNFYTIPSDCSSGGGQEEDDLLSLGANGILGIGPIQYDCGSACVPSSGLAPTGAYYQCSASLGCQATFVSLSQQVQNPVALFSTDNNGVIIELPAVSGPTASLNGSIVFGIGTQSNNGLGSATVLTLNQYQSINTTYKGKVMPYSFIDTGSNAYFFPDTNIPQDSYGWYIPATTLNLTATNEGYNGKISTVSFNVSNADTMFSANSDDAVLNTLAGYNYGYFDWGLPFFYGRNFYIAITPDGNGSYWAY